jgi:poly(A) polymerase
LTARTDAIEPTIITPSGIDPEDLDQDALRAVQRLQERGYEAYLVGGCIRDLLAGSPPKDFDIATSASPQNVRRCFPRNCRIIGRRFKLAHLHFNGNQKILEVSTFRRQPEMDDPEDGDLLITQDNEFGTAEEDALRRDFTVNALFLDPIKDRIIDYVDGLSDIQHKVIRCIGDPLVRFREDPVRILRAAKFCGRLGFHADADTHAAMLEVAPDLTRSAPPRLLEEILRLLRGGHALDSFQLLRDIGAIGVVLPVIGKYLAAADTEERVVFWHMLEALDTIHGNLPWGRPAPGTPANGLLLGALYARPVQAEAARSEGRSATSIAEELIQPFAEELRLPRRDTGCVKRICGVQGRFTTRGKRRFKVSSFLRDPYFAEALDLFELTCAATGKNREDLSYWRDLASQSIQEDEEPAAAESTSRNGRQDSSRRGSGRKRSSRKKTGSSRAGTEAAASSAAEESPRRSSKRGGSKKAAGKKAAGKKASSKKSRKKTGRASQKIETIEPEAVDLSAFDVELDPKRVPTFGTIVEGHSKKKKARKVPDPDSDSYKPPPPPGTDDDSSPPPPPPAGNDVFGDW